MYINVQTRFIRANLAMNMISKSWPKIRRQKWTVLENYRFGKQNLDGFRTEGKRSKLNERLHGCCSPNMLVTSLRC